MVRKRFFFFIVILLSGVGICRSQNHIEPEDPNVRIDPEWFEVNRTMDYCLSQDLIVDKQGNSYITGYFKGWLTDGETNISGKCNDFGHCYESPFIIKRNAAGHTLWVWTTLGHARPAKLSFDAGGDILLVGTLYSDTLHFSEGDAPSYILRGKEAGIFLCRIDTSGHTKKGGFISRSQNEQANSLVIGEKGNLYIGGTRHFQTETKRGDQQRAFLILKLDPDWKQLWEMAGDTIGQSQVITLAFRKNQLFIAGGYERSIKIGGNLKTHSAHDYIIYLACLKPSGEVRWINDSLSDGRVGTGTSLVMDQKGYCYLWAGNSYHTPTLARIDPKGRLVWSKSLGGRTSLYTGPLLIDGQNRLYMGGYGYRAELIGLDGKPLRFNAKGGIDGYLASYSDEGNLLWLKAMGGQGSDYIFGIGLYEDRLIACGITGMEMPFYQTSIPEEYGKSFWTASFSLTRLRDLKANDGNPLPVPEKWPKVDTANCSCEQELTDNHGNPISLRYFTEKEKIESISHWWQSNGDSTYKQLFLRDLVADYSRTELYREFELLSFRPVVWNPPDSAYSIEFFPCESANHGRSVKAFFSQHHGILQDDPAFKVEEFDSSIQAYLDIHLQRTSYVSTEEMYGSLLDEDPELGLLPELIRCSRKYTLNIEFDENDGSNWLSDFSKTMEEKNIGIREFLLNEFLKPESTKKHRITEGEKERFNALQYRLPGQPSIEHLDRIIHPSYRLILSDAAFRLHFHPQILRAKLADSAQYPEGLSILVESRSLDWGTYTGLELEPISYCIPNAEIGNTGIGINFDTLNFHFSGISIQDCRFELPFQGKIIPAHGTQVVLNNHFISGTIFISTVKNLNEEAGKFRLKEFPELGPVDSDFLNEYFMDLGFTSVHIKSGVDYFAIHFFYVNPAR